MRKPELSRLEEAMAWLTGWSEWTVRQLSDIAFTALFLVVAAVTLVGVGFVLGRMW